MPELPEVEVTRRSFADAIAGATVLGAFLGKPLRWPLGVAPSELVGRRVAGVRRRGKYLLLDLDQGLLLVHLGMSGSLRFARELAPNGPHDHFDLLTSAGTLRLHDPRRFGAVVWAPSENSVIAQKLLGHLGVEPFSEAFTVAHMQSRLKASTSAIKQALLQGHIVVGVGNIYACEALFLAGISPVRPSCELSRARVERLHDTVVRVLAEAVDKGGSTLKDFSSTDGVNGHYQFDAWVYGRQAQPCRNCATPIGRITQGQRSTYFCPRCQKR